MQIRRFGFVIMFASLPTVGYAASYSMAGLEFETDTRQNVWGPGAAHEISGTYFAGGEWKNESFSAGGIAGSISTESNPLHDLWQFCIDNGPDFLCSSEPSRTITVDTRTGTAANVTTSGKAGFDLNYKLSAGSVGASVKYDIDAVLPDAGTLKKGQGFMLDTSSTLADGAIDSQSPTAEASVDAVLDIDASASGTACFLFAGCTTSSGTLFNINEDREMVSIDPNEITYLGGFTGPYANISTPLLNQTVTLEGGILNGVPIVFPDGPGIPTPGVAASVTLGEIEVSAPTFQATGGLVGNSLAVNGRGDILDVRADIDALMPIIPPGGINFGLGPLGVSVDAYDFKGGPSLDLYQDLKLTPELMVDFDFSRPVEIAGQLVDTFTGAWSALPEMKIFGKTTFTPNFFVSALLESVTGLQIGLELTLDFLKGSIGMALLSADFGPLVQKQFAFDPDWAKFSIFSDTFAMGGFNSLQGTPFTLTASPIPLPFGFGLLASGLGLFWLVPGRRRRAGAPAA